MENLIVNNKEISDEFENNEADLLESIKKSQAKVQRNSFLEPIDVRVCTDKRTGVPLGASKIILTGRNRYGTSKRRRSK